MSLYADCDYSVIDQLPASRLPIKTVVMADASRNKLIDRVRSYQYHVDVVLGLPAY